MDGYRVKGKRLMIEFFCGQASVAEQKPAAAAPPTAAAPLSERARNTRQQQQQQRKKAGEPTGVSRAKHWSVDVENAFRLQEAGYKGEEDLMNIYGEPPAERWPESGFIRKLPTSHSLAAGARVLLYFRKTPECEPKYVNRVKLYRYN